MSCTWPEHIHMGQAGNLAVQWSEEQRRFSYLPQLEGAMAELNFLSVREGVPAVIKEDQDGGKRLHLYGAEYYVGLYPTPRGGGYTLSFISVLDLDAHEELAKGMLMLRGPGYILHAQIRDIPGECSNY